MAFANKDLSVIAYANGFTHWHYITTDAPAEIIAPGYFNGAADLIRRGDMLLVNADFNPDPVNFMIGATSVSNGMVTVSALWSPPAAAASDVVAAQTPAATLTAGTDGGEDARTEAAKRIAWAMRDRLSVSYRNYGDIDSFWSGLIAPDREAAIEAAHAALAEA